MTKAREEADREFEVVPGEYGVATSKLYSRGVFLALDDDRGLEEGDFVGRLRALFGPSEEDTYVLRHRATGFIVTAYSAQSGPSYGGAPRFVGELPQTEDAWRRWSEARERDDPQARIAADPELAAGRPSTRTEHRDAVNDPVHIHRLFVLDHAWDRRFADALAPIGFAEVVARLDALLSAVAPADWEALRYYSDAPGLYRVGAHDGEGFTDELGVAESLALLLEYAERHDDGIHDTAGSPFGEPNMRAVEFWVTKLDELSHEHEHEHDEDDEDEDDDDEDDDDEDEDDDAIREALRRTLPRVQAAWFRAVDDLIEHDPDLRLELGDMLLEQSEALEIDHAEAEDALASVDALRPS